MQTTSAVISCFFNKRKRNVIVLFVSTFKNTTLVLIPGLKWRETKQLNGEKEKTMRKERKGEKGGKAIERDEERRQRSTGTNGKVGEKREWREYLRRY